MISGRSAARDSETDGSEISAERVLMENGTSGGAAGIMASAIVRRSTGLPLMLKRFASASQNLRPIMPAAPITKTFIFCWVNGTMNHRPVLHKKTIAAYSRSVFALLLENRAKRGRFAYIAKQMLF